MEKRFWEIDFLRGIAVIMMIIFHFLFDLVFFRGYNINVSSGLLLYFARMTAFIFIFLVGVSLTISYSRAIKKQKTNLFTKYLKRGAKIFSWGLAITLVTWLFFREEFIIFGVLHFIGLSIILAYPLIKYKWQNLVLGVFFIVAGFFLSKLTFNFSWLMWLGFIPKYFCTLDYFPLLPWFGVVLIGLFFGNLLYKNNRRIFKIADLSKNYLIIFFSFLGRHSLFVYLVHQPALILMIRLAAMLLS